MVASSTDQLGKIIDVKDKGKVLPSSLYKHKKYLTEVCGWLNQHDMATHLALARTDDVKQYHPRFRVVDLTSYDIVPVEVD